LEKRVEILEKEDRGRYRQELHQNGIVEDFKLPVRCRDGSTIWISTSTRAFFDADGNVTHYEGVVIEIPPPKSPVPVHVRLYGRRHRSPGHT
jgi:PAS domain S-box-containing protein